MTNQLTRDQFASLKEEDHKLYREVWQMFVRMENGRKWIDIVPNEGSGATIANIIVTAEKCGNPTRQVYERIEPVDKPLATLKVGDITQTVGGHEVRNFRKLDKPIVRYSNYTMVYSGEIFNDYTKEFQECQWNEFGQVLNRNVPKYDVDISALTPAPPVDTVEQASHNNSLKTNNIMQTHIYAIANLDAEDLGDGIVQTFVNSEDADIFLDKISYDEDFEHYNPNGAYDIFAIELPDPLQALLSSQQREIEELREQLKNR